MRLATCASAVAELPHVGADQQTLTASSALTSRPWGLERSPNRATVTSRIRCSV
jgi:hypothetical protein